MWLKTCNSSSHFHGTVCMGGSIQGQGVTPLNFRWASSSCSLPSAKFWASSSSLSSAKFVESTKVSRVPKQLVPLPVNFQTNIQNSPDDHEILKEIAISVPSMITVKNKDPNIGGALEEAELARLGFTSFLQENEGKWIPRSLVTREFCLKWRRVSFSLRRKMIKPWK